MANSTVTLTQNDYPYGYSDDVRTLTYRGAAVITAGNYVSGGIPLDFTAMVDSAGDTVGLPTPYTNPAKVTFQSTTTGDNYIWDGTPGAGQGTMRVFAGATELTAGSAVPSGNTDDVINFEVVFAKG